MGKFEKDLVKFMDARKNCDKSLLIKNINQAMRNKGISRREMSKKQKISWRRMAENLEAKLSSLRQEEESEDMRQTTEIMPAYQKCSELTEGMCLSFLWIYMECVV